MNYFDGTYSFRFIGEHDSFRWSYYGGVEPGCTINVRYPPTVDLVIKPDFDHPNKLPFSGSSPLSLLLVVILESRFFQE